MKSMDDKNLELVEVEKLQGHTDRVWSMAWNPTADAASPVLASCSGDNTVRIWQQSSLSRSWTCKVSLSLSCFILLFEFDVGLLKD